MDKPLSSPALVARRSAIRAARPEDAARLADMFMRVFRKGSGAGDPALQQDIRDILIEHPDRREGVETLVLERGDGDLAGMIGSVPIPMRFDNRDLLASASSTWMVENRTRDPLAASQLLRAYFRGPRDITFADTVNGTTLEFQKTMKQSFLPTISLQWVFPINYAGYVAAAAVDRSGLSGARGLVPLAARAEEIALRLARRARTLDDCAYEARACARGDFASAWSDLAAGRKLRPLWSQTRIEWILGHAERRASLGPLALRRVCDERGDLAGCGAYHVGASGRGLALTILARPHLEADVLRALLRDARAQGCVRMCGAADAQLMQGLARVGGVFYRHTCASVIDARDPQVLQTALAGDAVFGGLVGDGWSPLATESYAFPDDAGGRKPDLGRARRGRIPRLVK
ncbi:MAG: hypothetical protein KGM42_15270 [Hyphomicrobiales bacterium]|nr:hypothetical protein [Hyphomicrobiales bacterium]